MRSPDPLHPGTARAAALLLAPAAECGECHVTHEAEWRSSPHAGAGADPSWYAVNRAGQEDTGGALGQFCVGCHMPEFAGRATPDGPLRTLHRHTVAGVDVPLEEVPGRREQIADAARLLEGAAELELGGAADGDSVRVAATVRNVGTGHDLPSGATFDRELWIELRVEDANGASVFMSGALDASQDLMGNGDDPQLALWQSTLLDAGGAPTPFGWRAQAVVSRSIPAESASTALYRFPRPGGPGPLRVEARLRFRALSPRPLRSRGLADRVSLLPLFTIDAADLTIALSPPPPP